MSLRRFSFDCEGKEIIIETGRFGPQANASVTVQMGETVVLASVLLSKEARQGIDFFPLMVDYEERFYAAGKIKGGRFSKREGKPSNDAVIAGRCVDRGIRPLFPQKMRNEVQVICMPLTFDGVNRADVAALIGACTALHLSDIPFDGPVVGVRIGRIDGKFVVNPSVEEIEKSDLQLLVTGNGSRITMVECEANEVPDDVMVEAFREAVRVLGPLSEFIDGIRREIGKPKIPDSEITFEKEAPDEDQELVERLKACSLPHLDSYLFNTPKGSKGERKEILAELEELIVAEVARQVATPERDEEACRNHLRKLMSHFFYEFIEQQVTRAILDRDQRVDGRALMDIRPLGADVSVLPRLHGTGFFRRGETHVLSVVTLGAPGDQLSTESMEDNGQKRYFHHYNFPPFSVGEVKKLQGAGRREIGHGALAEKALRPVLPTQEEFPYTVRVVSEVMSSNGSSSMASTCASSLALMDAGVPLRTPVAGIAIGLASDGERWKVLTDLQDLEDGPGGMDFKVTSTRFGITAIQMDTKTPGLSMDIVAEAIARARAGNDSVLNLIQECLPAPRPELSPFAPRIISLKVPQDRIGEVIGPGGKIIRSITDETGVQIDIEDDGTVLITSTDAEMAKLAEKRVRDIVREIKVGEVFEAARVVTIKPFGAFVNLVPGQDGMLHISEIEYGRLEKVEDRVNLGDKVRVVVTKVTPEGKIDVSMKALLPAPPGWVEPPRRPRGEGRPSRGGDRDRGRGGDRDRGRGGDRRGGDRDRGRGGGGYRGDRERGGDRERSPGGEAHGDLGHGGDRERSYAGEARGDQGFGGDRERSQGGEGRGDLGNGGERSDMAPRGDRPVQGPPRERRDHLED